MEPSQALLNLFKAAADSLRLQVLRVLQTDSYNVAELCEIFGVKQPALSHHLKVLSSTGLVALRKEGTTTFYRRNSSAHSDTFRKLHSELLNSVDTLDITAEFAEGIARIKLQRSERAREFFDKNVDLFKEQQELIALPEQYLPVVRETLERTLIGPASLAVEIGVGQGDFLPTLTELFQQVVALDISESMIETAKSNVPEEHRSKVRFFLGEPEDAVSAGIQATHIICNMVLHHVPSPADIFKNCANLLTAGGVLVVTDLCRHNQKWAIERCGDMWLGFESAELTSLARLAGFTCVEKTFYGLKNGFQIQTRRFEKLS